MTIKDYNNHINAHIKPALGAVRLDGLEPHMIQKFYNNTMSDKNGTPLAAKSFFNIQTSMDYRGKCRTT